MCGRFTFTPEPSEILTGFPDLELPPDVVKRYNVAPSDAVVAVTSRNGERAIEKLKWGLVPSWAKDARIGNSLINARADSVQSKPAFRGAFKKRRCLVLADGFYEWRKDGKKRRPFYFRLLDGRLFAFAGLWEIWKPVEGEYLLSCSLITTEPNTLVGEVHDRMPAILAPSSYDAWLDTTRVDEERAHQLLKPYPADEMTSWEVSPLVNSPRNDSPQCIAPLISRGEEIETLDLF